MMLLLFFATCFLAYSNGANDNLKGVASLFGSGTTSYRTAIGWATVTTFAGSIAALMLTTEALVADIPEDEKAPAGGGHGGGGGMPGGMGGMY